MKYDLHIYELIDKYLTGKLHGKELDDFNRKLKEDAVLRSEVEDYKELIALMDYHERVTLLKQRMNEIHGELMGDESTINRKAKRSKYFDYLPQFAIAASIALIISFGTLFFSGWFSYMNRDHDAAFRQLKTDIQGISSTQNNLWKAILGLEANKKTVKPSGTAFAIAENGFLVTNLHVIRDADSIYIVNQTIGDKKYKCKIVFIDHPRDLAILQVDDSNFKSFGHLPYSLKSGISELGEYVYTLGYSKKEIVFGEGSVSSLTGFAEDTTSYQVSIPVNPGNSGGPLLDSKGNLIGIISGKHSTSEGVTFAVKSEFVLGLVDSITTLESGIKPLIPKSSKLSGLKRTEQVKKLTPFIFKVEVYN